MRRGRGLASPPAPPRARGGEPEADLTPDPSPVGTGEQAVQTAEPLPSETRERDGGVATGTVGGASAMAHATDEDAAGNATGQSGGSGKLAELHSAGNPEGGAELPGLLEDSGGSELPAHRGESEGTEPAAESTAGSVRG